MDNQCNPRLHGPSITTLNNANRVLPRPAGSINNIPGILCRAQQKCSAASASTGVTHVPGGVEGPTPQPHYPLRSQHGVCCTVCCDSRGSLCTKCDLVPLMYDAVTVCRLSACCMSLLCVNKKVLKQHTVLCVAVCPQVDCSMAAFLQSVAYHGQWVLTRCTDFPDCVASVHTAWHTWPGHGLIVQSRNEFVEP